MSADSMKQGNMKQGDKNTIANIRYRFKERVAEYSDEQLLKAYKLFCISEDYPDEEKIFLWIDVENVEE